MLELLSAYFIYFFYKLESVSNENLLTKNVKLVTMAVYELLMEQKCKSKNILC